MAAAQISAALLAHEPVYGVAAALGAVLALLALLGHRLDLRARYWAPASIPYYFLSMNLALLLGLIAFVRGTQSTAWTPTARVASSPGGGRIARSRSAQAPGRAGLPDDAGCRGTRGGNAVTRARLEPLRTLHLWLPGYAATRLRDAARGRRRPITRVWVTIADHFEPWWRRADERTALERVRRWTRGWPRIAAPARRRRRTTALLHLLLSRRAIPSGRDRSRCRDWRPWASPTSKCICIITPTARERLSIGSDGSSSASHTRHGLLRRDDSGIRFGFIHGNWALDNSLPGGLACGLDNEITLLRRLGCYADFTLPSAPSPAQTRIVNTIYWAKDDPARPKSHDTGVPVTANGGVAGDLLMIPGPLTLNLREWRRPLVPRLEVGELAGNCRPTRHRVALWKRAAPRIGEDLFIKLFAHGAPEKNAGPMLADGGVLDRTLRYLRRGLPAFGSAAVLRLGMAHVGRRSTRSGAASIPSAR